MIKIWKCEIQEHFSGKENEPPRKAPEANVIRKKPKEKSPKSLYLLKLTKLNGLQLYKLLKKRKRNVFYKLFLSWIKFLYRKKYIKFTVLQFNFALRIN